VLWAAVYGAFGLVCALSGVPLWQYGVIHGATALDWAVVAVGVLVALVCGAVVRHGLRPALRVLLWALCGLTGIVAFGLLMDVITLLTGEGVDSWAAAANRSLAAAGTLLLAATAKADHRPTSGAVAPAPSPASLPVQLAAIAGTVAFLPYAAMKLVWAFGGTFAGISRKENIAISKRNGASGIWLTLESWGLDVTVLLAALGVFLVWGLVRPWGQAFPRWALFLHGRRVPRWLPLTPALIGAATLTPYGVLGLGYCTLAATGLVTMRQGDAPSPGDALQMGWIGTVAFAAYGVALTIAARSYWRRTRPINQDPVHAE
jgi:D-alanyl-D-alanine dipeptidase